MRLTFLPIAAALFVTPATAQTTAPADSLTTDTTGITSIPSAREETASGTTYHINGTRNMSRPTSTNSPTI